MKIMAVDYGDARTGIAVCDRTEFLASPIGTLEEWNAQILCMKIAHLAQQYEVGEIVVGYPKNMNGSVGPRAQKCEAFADMLSAVTEVPVKLWDERSTTVAAHNYLNETNVRGKKRKEVVDQVAATIILESYLDYRRKKKAQPSSEG
ncbi:MAG: Holliday junction resolvase RuvX [Oscillospiraceae bacterium]|nr:Holliday junction resolvase RuvX [Oscillospiraceae bacterium]